MFKIKGERFIITGIEMSISDTPKNKPINIEIKPLQGLTGKVHLKIYDINGTDGTTIMITKVSGGDLIHVKTPAFKVITFLLDGIITGDITDKNVECFKKKTVAKNQKPNEFACDFVETVFPSKKGLMEHKKKVHVTSMRYDCCSCEEKFQDRKDMVEHQQFPHDNIKSPEQKKVKIVKKELKSYREIDAQVNEKDFETQNEQEDMEVDKLEDD